MLGCSGLIAGKPAPTRVDAIPVGAGLPAMMPAHATIDSSHVEHRAVPPRSCRSATPAIGTRRDSLLGFRSQKD
ncbi:hypothetical protein GE454_13010 [Pseudomonas soli]|nr:hypothetical protein C3F42_20885 [Pseudomonas sp. PONIH3]MDW9403987.1 hypothetical protein [Pseudomonas soli]